MKTIPFSTSVVVLTGAGISIASGIAPFRGPGGIWNDEDLVELSTHDGLMRHPYQVALFMKNMRQQVRLAEPNIVHELLARAEKMRSAGARFDLITQNVDGLHRRAGSKTVHEIHGRLETMICMQCQKKHEQETEDAFCDCGGVIRSDIVLFDEDLPTEIITNAHIALKHTSVFVAVGTSGMVWPAASFVADARDAGAYCINVNVEASGNKMFHEEIVGEAKDVLPVLFGI
jgi:NAD-dependent deacetylase